MSLVWCVRASLIIATPFAFAYGNFHTNFHELSLMRVSGAQAAAMHHINNWYEQTHPFVRALFKRNIILLPNLVVALARVGVSTLLAVVIEVVLFREIFAIAISWLVYAVTETRAWPISP